jgi:hypothetical protein
MQRYLGPLAGAGSEFLTKSKGLLDTVLGSIGSSTGTVDDTLRPIFDLSRDIQQAGRNVFHAVDAIAGMPNHVIYQINAIAGNFQGAYCDMLNGFDRIKSVFDLDPLFGASNCSSTGGGAIRRNILLGTKQRAPAISANRMKTLYVEAKTCTIEGNVVTEGEWAIYVHSSGAGGTVVRGNVVLQTDAESLIGIQNAGENGQRTEHNVCVRLAGAASPGSSFGITQFTSGLTGTRIANNIVVGYETAYRAGVFDAATVSNNCAHDYDELLVDASLVARAMTAPVAADPLFIDPTRPWLGLKPDSPTWRAGAHVQGARDRYNRRYSIPPNIGPWAVQSR